MKKTTGVIIAAVFVLGLTGLAMGANPSSHNVTITIPSIMHIATTGDATLEVTDPGTAGDSYFGSAITDNSVWLNYTVLASGSSNYITAEITNNSVPADVDLTLESAAPTGFGTVGSAVGSAVTLDDEAAHTIIDNIGSCWTGTGSSNGAQLTYTLDLEGGSNAYDLEPTSTVLTVEFTITN